MNKPIDLMNLYWTTSGYFPGDGDISRYDFKDRVESAAKAGFTGIGIWHTDLEHILFSRSLDEMKAILDDNGIKHLELEFLTDWFLDGARKRESDSRKKRLLEASATLGASHVKIGDFYNSVCPMSQIVDSFGELCKEAEDYGATIGFEFMSSAMIDNLQDALHLVETVAAKNGGLIIDIAHVIDIGISYDDLKSIPLRYLLNVELNDATFPNSPNHDPSRIRRFCGEGDYDIKGFINTIFEIGYTGAWAVEVFSHELPELPLDELNKRAFDTTIAHFSDY